MGCLSLSGAEGATSKGRGQGRNRRFPLPLPVQKVVLLSDGACLGSFLFDNEVGFSYDLFCSFDIASEASLPNHKSMGALGYQLIDILIPVVFMKFGESIIGYKKGVVGFLIEFLKMRLEGFRIVYF